MKLMSLLSRLFRGHQRHRGRPHGADESHNCECLQSDGQGKRLPDDDKSVSTSLSCQVHSSIVSPSAAVVSSSSSPSIAFLAAFSASSKRLFGTS